MADTGAFSIDLPLMATVTADLEGLVCTGNSALGELGALVLDGVAFGEIGSVVGSVNGRLHDNLLSSLTTGMGFIGTLNGALQCCASDYAALDSLISDSFASLMGDSPSSTPAAGTSPADVNKWWKGLSSDQQAALVAGDPAKIGAMDGVPDSVRDAANRTVLSNLRTQTQQQINDLKNTPTSPYDDYPMAAALQSKQIGELQTKLDGMNELQKVLDDGGHNGAPQKYLLGIDTGGVGHAIIASGNPDTSDNVVTVVPGVSTDLSAGHVDQYTKAADSIVAAAHHADPNHSTSAIAWMNYNAPATVPGALFDAPAKAGGPVLDSFQQGLYATHDPADPMHTTVIGHSYGTTVVGEATQAPGGLRADDVVLAASPGIDVDNAAAMHVPGGTAHVWATRDDNDPIIWAEGFHNTDPVTPAFGAHVFNSGVGPSWDPIGAHDYYFDPSSPAMANFGEIATGHYNQVTSPPPVEPDPAWSFPMFGGE